MKLRRDRYSRRTLSSITYDNLLFVICCSIYIRNDGSLLIAYTRNTDLTASGLQVKKLQDETKSVQWNSAAGQSCRCAA